jgi:hypothetical protein
MKPLRSGLPFQVSPSAEIITIVKLVIEFHDLPSEYSESLEKYLRQCFGKKGGFEAAFHPETGLLDSVYYTPFKKSDQTKPQLTEMRNKIGDAVNEWYRITFVKN